MDCVSTPVRSQRLPPVASPPVTKPYMRNRDTREALTPTEPEMSPVKTDDYIYPLLVEESPAGKQVDDTWFSEGNTPFLYSIIINNVSQILVLPAITRGPLRGACSLPSTGKKGFPILSRHFRWIIVGSFWPGYGIISLYWDAAIFAKAFWCCYQMWHSRFAHFIQSMGIYI